MVYMGQGKRGYIINVVVLVYLVVSVCLSACLFERDCVQSGTISKF